MFENFKGHGRIIRTEEPWSGRKSPAGCGARARRAKVKPAEGAQAGGAGAGLRRPQRPGQFARRHAVWGGGGYLGTLTDIVRRAERNGGTIGLSIADRPAANHRPPWRPKPPA